LRGFGPIVRWRTGPRQPTAAVFHLFFITTMPKMKTKSGAKKRFSLTGTGKIKRKHAFKSHILTKKTTKQKRALTHVGLVSSADMNRVKDMLNL
jgi:large subunit ribosomal protein L35